MKAQLILSAIFGAMLFSAPAVNADNSSIVPPRPINIQGGPGIAVSMTSSQAELPEAAQRFLQTIYSRDVVGPVTFNAVKDRYKVIVGNGTQIVFDKKGKVDDIQAPQGESLYARAVSAILPEKAYKHLESAGLLEYVTGIKDAQGRGKRVMLLNAMPPEVLFDVDGVFVILND